MSPLENTKIEVIKTDILVPGGGLAGCYAAIKVWTEPIPFKEFRHQPSVIK